MEKKMDIGSILQLYKENRQPSLAFESIVVRMIANAWKYVYAEGGMFPKLDQIPRYVEEVKERTPLGRFSDGKYVEDVVAKSNAEDTRCPYSLHEDHIEINPLWREYLLKNYDELLASTEQGLREYLK